MMRLGGSRRLTSLFDEFLGKIGKYANVGVQWEGEVRARRMGARCAVAPRWADLTDASLIFHSGDMSTRSIVTRNGNVNTADDNSRHWLDCLTDKCYRVAIGPLSHSKPRVPSYIMVTYRSASFVVVQIHLFSQGFPSLAGVDELSAETEPEAYVVAAAAPLPDSYVGGGGGAGPVRDAVNVRVIA